jgi:hypothetical protein
LATYIKESQYRAYVLPYGSERQLGQTSLRVASPVEWGMALADLDALAPERREQARRTYERLAAANPRRWEPYAGLGYLALAMQDRTAASRNFALAEELDCSDPRMYLDWAALAPPAKRHRRRIDSGRQRLSRPKRLGYQKQTGKNSLHFSFYKGERPIGVTSGDPLF